MLARNAMTETRPPPRLCRPYRARRHDRRLRSPATQAARGRSAECDPVTPRSEAVVPSVVASRVARPEDRALAPKDWAALAMPGLIWGSSFYLIAEGLDSFEPFVVTWMRILFGLL